MTGGTKRGGGQTLVDHLRLCETLGVLPDTWRKRVSRGLAPLPHSHMGKLMYYRTADVRAFLRDGRWPARMRFAGRPGRGGD